MRRIIDRTIRVLRRRLGAWRAVLQARRVTEQRLRAGPLRRMLVVCYGNIYRSPFVGEYLRAHLPIEVEVRTRGFHPVAERPSPARHVEMCRRLGIDLSAHRSTILSQDDLEWADSVVLMDRHNWVALIEAGVAPEKLLWLGALGSGSVEIPDPYAMDAADAERVLRRMQRACDELIHRVSQAHKPAAASALSEAASARTP